MKIRNYLKEINYSAIQKKSEKLHASAKKEGSIKIDGEKYFFHFVDGEYIVLDDTDNEMVRFNTRKLADAKKWLKDWLRS